MSVSKSIPQRDLRNNISSVLAAVSKGKSFEVTVRGKPVAELLPIHERTTYVSRDRFVQMFSETPLDRGFLRDVDGVLDQTVEDL